jgi:hypothetical protein
MAEHDHDPAVTEDEAALAPFFAAAHAAAPAPSPTLLAAILADAAEASALRSLPVRRRPGLRDRLARLGGWRVAAPLAAAAAAGFWVGLAADLDIADPAAWLAPPEAAADPVAAFFDLAAAEN